MPPKKKDTSKKPNEIALTLINGSSKEEISKEQLEEHIVRLRGELDRERQESNLFQLKMQKIHTFQKISDRKLEEDEARLKNLESVEEDDEGRHQSGIKMYKQKMKHLLCEHQNTVSDLKAGGLISINVQQKEYDELEAELYKTMTATVVDIQNLDIENRVRELELKHVKEMIAIRDNLERLITNTKTKNVEKMQLEQQKLEHFEITATSEQKLQWDTFITALMEDHNNTISAIKEAAANMFCRYETLDMMTADELEVKIKRLQRTRRKMNREKHSFQQKNGDLTELILKLEGKIAHNQAMTKICSKNELKIPKRKALENLKADHKVMEKKFSELQLERDELSKSFSEKIQSIQDKGYLVNRLLEGQLQTLEDHLQEVQAQLHSVLSAPNMDHTALTEVTHKAKEYVEYKNDIIKELENKKTQISKACKDLQLTAETRALFS